MVERPPVSKQIYIFKNTLFPIIKIGMSDNPSKRITTIECASGFPLELVYESEPILRPQVTEKLIHRLLKDYNTRGEWFEVSVEEAIKVINKAVSEANTGEYKNLIKDYIPKKECVEVYDYHIKNTVHSNHIGDVAQRYELQEEFIYVDNYYNYYILYTQGILNRTAKFCNLYPAKKFKNDHFDRLVSMK